MAGNRITMLVGGNHHDFEAFAAEMGRFLHQGGYQVEIVRDADVLRALPGDDPDIVLLYTCLDGAGEGGGDFTSHQASSLRGWVRAGGALIALHASTVRGPGRREMKRLLGGCFVSHPPDMRSFTVTPTSLEHPITRGIEAFEVFDEFYVESCDDTVQVHMTATHEDSVYPMVWSRKEGKGRVVHIAPGHDRRVWNLPAYRRLVLQSVRWATAQ